MTGLNLMDKMMAVRGAKIAYSIWDVAGNLQEP
jgi:Rab family, other